MIYHGNSGEIFQIKLINSTLDLQNAEQFDSSLTFLWFGEDDNQLEIDGVKYTLQKNQVVSLTEFHKVSVIKSCTAKMLRFNRAFYCITDHDADIGCKGILFFGAAKVPILTILPSEIEKFSIIWRMIELEIQTHDNLQLEMLQSMLKRFIIMCTRLYKMQENYESVDAQQQDLLRNYNFLVEQHFKTKHTVAEYADLLHKSPKTLANIFAKVSEKTPLRYIHERKVLEARRLLKHSKLSIKEIAYEIGFADMQTFGRFFKNMEGLSPSEYKLS